MKNGLNDLNLNEKNDVVRQMYHWKINEKIAEVRMMRATLYGDDKKFDRYASFVYGTPEKNIYNYTLWQTMKKMQSVISAENSTPEQKNAAQQILNLQKDEIQTSIDPHKKTESIHFISSQESYAADDIKKAFSDALVSKNIDGWDVITDPNIKAISVSQDDKKIKIPST